MPVRLPGLLIIAAAMAMAPAGAISAAPASAALRVVTTTTDLAALAAAVGGDLVSVESIVPPATDPKHSNHVGRHRQGAARRLLVRVR
jgi:ABC-type Zn uptake system ZnuABC Zn-binding protein ZnuA